MTIKALYPNVRPSLDLNFARTRALDPRITFTRASTGTFVGSNGLMQTAASGAARFDHNPATGESLGLLVEEARTNLVRYSQDITNVAWDKANLTATKETISGPAGTIEYDKITLGTFTNSSGQIRIPITASSGTVYSNSVYVKQGTCRYVHLIQQYNNSSGIGAYFDLQTGTFLTGGGLTASSTTIQTLANGWYRIQLTVTDVGPGGSAGFLLSPMTIPNPVINGSGGREYNGNGEFIYAYGAQIEAGSFPTSYIPTTSAAVTRAVDVASITGANFSSVFDVTGGTMVAEYYKRVPQQGNGNAIWSLGSQAPSFFYTTGGGYLELDFALAIGTVSGANLPGKNKSAFKFQQGSYAASVNGDTIFTSSNATSWTTPVSLLIGASSYTPGTPRVNGPIARLTYYPTRLPNAQLQALTQ